MTSRNTSGTVSAPLSDQTAVTATRNGAQRVPRVAVLVDPEFAELEQAVVDGGGAVVPIAEAEALVWAAFQDWRSLRKALVARPEISWVQVPMAGVDDLIGRVSDGRVWTSAKGAHPDMIAEHAIALALAGMRDIHTYAAASTWTAPRGRTLFGASVTLLGGGAIAQSAIRLLEPFGTEITVVRRRPAAMAGAERVVGPESLHSALRGSDLVIAALALVPDTVGLLDSKAFGSMEPTAWLVNVARGRHVVTDDLVAALKGGAIAGAALDVTDPEPLPDGHPLWELPNCIITPHAAGLRDLFPRLLARRVEDNVRRFAQGEPLLGQVDPTLGY